MAWWHRSLPSLAIGALLLLGGCGDDTSASSSTTSTAASATTTTTAPPEPVEGLLATIAPNRLYATEHAFGLGLRNVGQQAVEVVAVELDSGLFDGAGPGDQAAVLQPGGRRFVLPLPYGEPRCDDPVDEHVALVTLAGGRVLRVPAVEEFDGAVARQHDRECRAAAVLERASLRFGDEWTEDGDAIHGQLLLEARAPGEPVVVEDVRGNVIFTLTADGDPEPILAVDDDRATASVAVTIDATRCDPHAIAEFKRPYVMLTWASLGDAEPVGVEVEATGAARAALDALIARCSSG